MGLLSANWDDWVGEQEDEVKVVEVLVVEESVCDDSNRLPLEWLVATGGGGLRWLLLLLLFSGG
jgi:hypothetical protein